MSLRARDIKEKNKQIGLHQNKKYLIAKENISKMKRGPTLWENIFSSDILDKACKYTKIYKEHTGLHTRKTNNPIKKWAKDWNMHFSKEDIQRTQRPYERILTMRYHSTLVRMTIINKPTNHKC